MLSEEAMNLLVCKIMELSSLKVDGLPEDYVDLAAEPETTGQLASIAGDSYQHTGRRITGVVPRKPQQQTPQKSKCC